MVIILKHMTSKEFIKNVLIDEFKDIVERHPYLAFSLICSGIELLGKCIDTKNNKWHTDNTISSNGKTYFDLAVDELFPEYYKQIEINIRDTMRNGLNHSLLPKENLGLSELKHLNGMAVEKTFFKQGNETIFIIELFYNDFKNACKKVIEMSFEENNKMNKGFLDIPNN